MAAVQIKRFWYQINDTIILEFLYSPDYFGKPRRSYVKTDQIIASLSPENRATIL